MSNPSPEAGALIAPGEIRELLARLTEQTVEAVPSGEARTLEGLAIETGIPLVRLRETLVEMRRQRRFVIPPLAWMAFVLLAGFGVWAADRTPVDPATVATLPPVPKPVKVEPDLTGTISLTDVTYGPDGGGLHVDPGFVPSTSLPEGLSVSATVGDVLWGSGDHRAKAIDRPLTADQERAVRANVVELLKYVREAAARRHVADGASPLNVAVASYMYNGVASDAINFPPPWGASTSALDAQAAHAANTLVEGIQSQLRWQESSRRENGP